MSDEADYRGTKPILAILGPEGTYTHQAAFHYFGDKVEYRPCSSISDAFQSLSSDIPHAMVPLVNSTHGMVIETYDQLRSERVPRDFSIVGDTTIKIELCLVVSGAEGDVISLDDARTDSHPDTQQSTPVAAAIKGEGILKSINVVYSHEQALAQCASWLDRNLPNAQRVAVSSTAAAAKMLLQPPTDHAATLISSNNNIKTEGNRAAIASEICVSLYPELRLVQKGIQDDTRNQTRFILISKSSSRHPTLAMPPLQSKAILRIPVTRSAGSSHTPLPLDRILQTATSTADPLLVERVERRPSTYGGAWDDIYFVDLEECFENRLGLFQAREDSGWESKIQAVCVRIREIGGTVDVLGTW